MRIREMLIALAGCVGVALVLGVPVASADGDACVPPDNEFNYLECYRINDAKGFSYTLDLEQHEKNFLPANTVEKSCSIRKRDAFELCVDVKVKNINPTPPGGPSALGPIPNAWDYLCYKVRCDRQSRPARDTQVIVTDALGERSVTVKRLRKVCVPLLDKPGVPVTTTTTLVPTTTTTTTSTTTTPTL